MTERNLMKELIEEVKHLVEEMKHSRKSNEWHSTQVWRLMLGISTVNIFFLIWAHWPH